MDEVIWKLWPYIERAGAVSALIFSVWLVLTLRELRDLRAKYEKVQENRIAEAQSMTSIIKDNTTATEAQADLIRTMVKTRGRG
jgi:hypothetical protein